MPGGWAFEGGIPIGLFVFDGQLSKCCKRCAMRMRGRGMRVMKGETRRSLYAVKAATGAIVTLLLVRINRLKRSPMKLPPCYFRLVRVGKLTPKNSAFFGPGGSTRETTISPDLLTTVRIPSGKVNTSITAF